MHPPENASTVRLKYFLARQIAKHGENVTPQQATVLAAIMWMEDYGGQLLNQKELCDLLHMVDTRMTAVLKTLRRRKLIAEVSEAASRRGKSPRITDEGRASVLQFADEVLGIPEELEKQLERRSDYTSIMEASNKPVDDFLKKYFCTIAAQTPEK